MTRLALRLRPRPATKYHEGSYRVKYLDTTVHSLQQVKELIDHAVEHNVAVSFLGERVVKPKPKEPWQQQEYTQETIVLDPKDYTINERGLKGSISVTIEDDREVVD